MKTTIEEGRDGFRDLDLSFHITVAAACNNEILTELLTHIRSGLHELISKSLLLPAGMAVSYTHLTRVFRAASSAAAGPICNEKKCTPSSPKSRSSRSRGTLRARFFG